MGAAATLAWLALLAVTPLGPQAGLPGVGASGRWVLVTPFAPGQRQKVLSLAEGTTSISLAGLGPGLAMICTGGPKAATLCERRLIEAGGAVPVAGPVAGVRITGGVRLGRHPAAGAQIALVPCPLAMRKPFTVPLYREGETLVSSVRADGKGRFAVALLAPGQYRLDVHLAGGRIVQGEPFTVPEPRLLRNRAEPPGTVPSLDLGELVVDDGVEVAVSVTDSAGRPIAGAGVGAIQDTEPGRDVLFETRSDGFGGARLAALAPGLPVAVTCLARGYARYEERFATPPAAVQCRLASLCGIMGKVVDEKQRPVSGAMVSLRGGQGTIRTDAGGGFALEGLRAGEHRLSVAAPEFKAARRDLTLTGGERLRLEPIELAAAGRLEGTVMDGVRQEPIAGAVVTIADPPGFGSATTGVDGGFVLGAGGESGLGLEVTAEGYPATVVPVSAERLASAEPLRVEIYPGGRIRATVWDEDADAPCLGCTVVVTPDGGHALELTTDRAGEAVSPPLPKGPCTATLEIIEASGSVVRVHGGDNVRRFEIEPGRITPVSFGERLPVLVVRFSSPLPAGWRLRADGAVSMLSVKPREDGSFAVRRRPSEPVVLSLAGPGGLVVRQAALPAGEGDSALDLSLPESRVGGTLLRGEEPSALARVSLLAADGTEAARAVTDESGAFLVPYVPPGNYVLVSGGAARRSFALGAGTALDLGPVQGPGAADPPAAKP
jgi:hypothetical protein